MTTIVNRGQPALEIKQEVKAIVNCPNCNAPMTLDAKVVDIGNVIECAQCEKKTYYPFEKPWYRKGKLVIGYVASIVISYIVGIASNYGFQQLTTDDGVNEQETIQTRK